MFDSVVSTENPHLRWESEIPPVLSYRAKNLSWCGFPSIKASLPILPESWASSIKTADMDDFPLIHFQIYAYAEIIADGLSRLRE